MVKKKKERVKTKLLTYFRVSRQPGVRQISERTPGNDGRAVKRVPWVVWVEGKDKNCIVQSNNGARYTPSLMHAIISPLFVLGKGPSKLQSHWPSF